MKNKLNIYLIILGMTYGSFAFAQSSTTSVSKTESKFLSKERWGLSYSNYMNGPALEKPSGETSINHFISVKHKFNGDWAVSGVVRPDSNFGGMKESWTMGDSYLKINYPTIYQSEGSFSIKGDVRYIAPTSESSKKAKLNGVISPYVQAGGKAGRFDLSYILIPKFYLNTVEAPGQKQYGHGHWLSASYKLSEKVNVDMAVYPAWTYLRDEPVAFNDLPAYPGFTVSFNEDFSISPYVEVPLLKAEAKNSSVGGTLNYKFF